MLDNFFDNILEYALVVVLLAVIVIVGVVLADSLITEQITSYGTVVDKSYIPAHNESYIYYTSISDGKNTTLIPMHGIRRIPDFYEIVILDKDKSIQKGSISPELYYSVEVGDSFRYTRKAGRLLHHTYSISLEDK